MELAELRAAYEEVRKILTLVTDIAVWADLMHKHPTDPNAPATINPKHLPGYVKKHEHVAKFGQVMAKVRQMDAGSATALSQDWVPFLHHIQSDDLVVTVAAIAQNDQDAVRDLLLQIAAVADPTPKVGGTRDEVLKRINAERTNIAASLHLIKAKPEMYGQYYVDQVKGGVFKNGADFVQFLQANWPTVKKTIIDRVDSINAAIERPPDPAVSGDKGGLHAQSLDFRARMAAKLKASQR